MRSLLQYCNTPSATSDVVPLSFHNPRVCCLSLGTHAFCGNFQSAFWCSLPQYATAWHLSHRFTPTAIPHILRNLTSTQTGRAARLNNLGDTLQRWYERTDEMADLEEAITATRQAIDATPADHPNRNYSLFEQPWRKASDSV